MITNGNDKPFIRKLTEQIISAIVVTGIVLLVLWVIWGKLFESEIEEVSSYEKFSSDSGLKIVNHREQRVGEKLEVLGAFENGGTNTWTSVTIEVELFDDKGEFVDECTKYVRGSFVPGTSENFKVNCGGCEEHPLPNFDSYTVRIVDASSF